MFCLGEPGAVLVMLQRAFIGEPGTLDTVETMLPRTFSSGRLIEYPPGMFFGSPAILTSDEELFSPRLRLGL